MSPSPNRAWTIVLSLILLLAVNALLGGPWATEARAAKNVIVMVADGAGFNSWIAASLYQGRLGRQVYNGPDWVALSCTTHPLNMSTKPTGKMAQDASLLYQPERLWDAQPAKVAGGGSGPFAGYGYAKTHYTDSAAAATALDTGVKTFNNAINWTNDNRSIEATIPALARARGMRCGVITTVPWSHATPAGLGAAHNANRNAYAAIANEMLAGGSLDVIMGAGHPEFDDDGRPTSKLALLRPADYVGGPATWAQLRAGTQPQGWKLIESKADFEALTSGATPPRVLGVAQVATTLQQKRRRAAAAADASGQSPAAPPAPFAIPLNANVPDLATMTRAAINCLDDDPDGFYLMIEGGAVDWANHANQPERTVEEQVDFVRAVEAVCDWVEKHSSWGETLVILTADHECGMLWGPQSDTVAFQPIEDRGAGVLPGMHHNAKGHTMHLVPLYARGPGSAHFRDVIHGRDPRAAELWHFDGSYVDNTDVFRVIARELTATAASAGSPK